MRARTGRAVAETYREGGTVICRKHRKPALGPLSDALDLLQEQNQAEAL